MKHHKLNRRVELKEREILEILKNLFGQFYKLTNDNNQLHTSYEIRSNLLYNFVSITTFTEIILLYCIHVDNLQHGYVLPSLKWFTSANYYDVLAGNFFFITVY